MKMKKMLACLSAACMLCAAVPFFPVQETAVISASAEDTEYIYENFKYTKSEDAVTITGYVEKPAGELVIPAEIDGLPVKFIGQGAFEYCEDITSLTIPDTLTTISSNAFRCVQRTKPGQSRGAVRTSSDENSIQTSAFYNCIGLKEIHVSDTHPTLCSIDGILFNKDKTEIIRYPAEKEGESYTIPETVITIRAGAFSGSAGLVSVTIPDSVTEIENYAFSYCSSLKSAVIPEGVTSIKNHVFYFCSALTSVTVPQSVAIIGTNAFYMTPWFEKMEAENPLFIINHILVSGKYAKGDVVIPDTVTDIMYGAFNNNSEVTSIFIPESVSNIVTNPGSTFSRCTALTKIEVSEKNPVYTSQDGVLFNKAKNILIQYPIGNPGTSYTVPSSVLIIADSAFYQAVNLKSVTIPESVTSLSSRSFYGCISLKSVTIPKSVTSIGVAAFHMCTALESVIIQNPDCEFRSGTFSNGDFTDYSTKFSGTLYVYENSKAHACAEKTPYSFAFIGAETPAESESVPLSVIPGDADNSGKVDILDVIVVNKAILGKTDLTDEQLKAADVNKNGKPDASDSLLIMKYIVGLIDSFA